MSYFPSDIPYMSEKELLENRIKIPKIEPYLKPCPFCGGKAKREESYNITGSGKLVPKYYIKCGNKDCGLDVATCYRETEEEAVEIWNRRVTE